METYVKMKFKFNGMFGWTENRRKGKEEKRLGFPRLVMSQKGKERTTFVGPM